MKLTDQMCAAELKYRLRVEAGISLQCGGRAPITNLQRMLQPFQDAKSGFFLESYRNIAEEYVRKQSDQTPSPLSVDINKRCNAFGAVSYQNSF